MRTYYIYSHVGDKINKNLVSLAKYHRKYKFLL